MIKEFKEFISRGNVVDLAVAVVIGAAFGLIVKSFTDDILGQLIAALGGKPDFSSLVLPLRTIANADGTTTEIGLRYGSFLTAIVNFVIVAFAVFLVVKAMNKMQNLRAKEEMQEAEISEVDLLTEIRDLLAAQSGTTPPSVPPSA
jgi:large conductance mechanosensitive channel